MENIYRGYPNGGHKRGQSQERMPYMLYRREDQRPQPGTYNGRQREAEYFKGLYPQSMKRCQSLVEAGCDRYDYPGSPIYDDYPDRESLYRIRDRILKDADSLGYSIDRDLTQLLLLQEVWRRRTGR